MSTAHDKSRVEVETLRHPNGPVARVLLRLVGSYQKLSSGGVPRCRYLPTCSEYASTAISRFGAPKGSALALRRICRCHPFGSHGFDPVPPRSPESPVAALPPTVSALEH